MAQLTMSTGHWKKAVSAAECRTLAVWRVPNPNTRGCFMWLVLKGRFTAASVPVMAAAALLLTSCSLASGESGPPAAGPTASIDPGGTIVDKAVPAAAAATPLIDQDGRTTSLASMRGHVVVLAPFMTLCQETCPMTSTNLRQAAQDALTPGVPGRPRFIELSVDPERDTVHRLHEYEKLYGSLPNWSLVTGHAPQVRAVWKALGVTTDHAPTRDLVRDWMTGRRLEHSYDVEHQDVVFVIDAVGHIRWLTIGKPDARGSALPGTLRHFLSAEGQRNYRHPGPAAGSWTADAVEQAIRYVARAAR
jgi:cytochrome oxidase Cu insertion factor (SCO1/SenC/PrrC family)